MSRKAFLSLRIVCLAALVGLACKMPVFVRPAWVPGPTAAGGPSPVPTAPAPTATLDPYPAPPGPYPFNTLPVPSASAAPQPTPTIAYQPVIEPAACAFPVPAGTAPECGYLVLPENRSRPGSPSIRLHVAVFRSTASDPAPDPVVHLAGGPGSSSLEVAGYLFRQGLGAILETRDFILFDQRGTGYSQPLLDCPEREALAPALLEGRLPPAEPVQAILEAFRQCRARLEAEGIDLSAYHSAASAADVNDLRRALGVPQLNLYGVSYGTRLALTVLRDFPQAVRSVVLDSTYPPQVHLYTALAPNAARAFAVLFARCAEDATCSTVYPDLENVFYGLVEELNARPVEVTLTAGGAARRVLLDGGLLIDVLFVGLYNPSVTASMPLMVYQIRQGEYRLLRERLMLYFDASSALGMQMAVQCAEEIPFAGPEEAWAAAQGASHPIASFFIGSVGPLFEICQAWGLPAPDPRENEPVASDIPALVLAGELDPITPPEWGRLAVETLSRGYFYAFPGNGHWVTRSTACALGMALAFWDDPGAEPDGSCIEELGGLQFSR